MATQNKELSLERFNYTRAELATLAETYKDLTIDGLEDTQGYELVKSAKKELQVRRTTITKLGKEMRDDANQFCKDVRDLEKSLLNIITPIEDELKLRLEEVEELKLKEKRKKALPAWLHVYGELGLIVNDDYILSKTDEELHADVFQIKEQKAEAERLRLEEEREAFEAEKRKMEQERLELERQKQEQANIEKARAEERERAQQELAAQHKREKEEAEARAKAAEAKAAKAEQDAKNAEVKAQKDKEEAEARRIQEDKDRKEQERKDAKAEEERKDREAKAEADRLEAERLEKIRQQKAVEADKKYQEYLKSINFNKETDIIKKVDNTLYMYRLVGEYTLEAIDG